MHLLMLIPRCKAHSDSSSDSSVQSSAGKDDSTCFGIDSPLCEAGMLVWESLSKANGCVESCCSRNQYFAASPASTTAADAASSARGAARNEGRMIWEGIYTMKTFPSFRRCNYIRTHTHYKYTILHIYICICIHIYIYTYIYIYIHTYTCTCVLRYTMLCICVSVHTYVYVYTHIYIYKYVYICIYI